MIAKFEDFRVLIPKQNNPRLFEKLPPSIERTSPTIFPLTPFSPKPNYSG